MSKKVIASVFLLMICLGLNAQDLIVTTSGDSIDCQIISMTDDTVKLRMNVRGVEKRAVMPRSMVAFYSMDDEAEWINPVKEVHKPDLPKMRISVSGGFGNLIGKVPPQIPIEFIPYMEELKSGNHFAASIAFFESKRVGIGVKYSYFNTRNQLKGIYVIDTSGTTLFGDMEDNITIQYIGPAVAIRGALKNNSAQFISNISIGIVSYLDHARVIDKIKLSGSTLGFSGDLGLDFQLEGGFHLGIIAGVVFGVIQIMEVEQGGFTQTLRLDSENYNNVSRVDLGISLSYYL